MSERIFSRPIPVLNKKELNSLDTLTKRYRFK